MIYSDTTRYLDNLDTSSVFNISIANLIQIGSAFTTCNQVRIEHSNFCNNNVSVIIIKTHLTVF